MPTLIPHKQNHPTAARPVYRTHGIEPAFTCSGVTFRAECINRNHFMIRQLIVIPAIFGTAETEAFELPHVDQNLFSRIIRSPQPAGRPPKDRE